MRALIEFHPELIGLTRSSEHGEGCSFDCPKCGPSHRLAVYFANPLDGQPPASWQNPTWQREGDDFLTLTISPSIQYPCFHGWVEDGQIIDVSESPLTIVMLRPDGTIGPVALSPRQVKAMVITAEPAAPDSQPAKESKP